MQRAIGETDRRRNKQIEFNPHGITPHRIVKAVQDIMEGARSEGDRDGRRGGAGLDEADLLLGPEQAMKRVRKLEAEMYKHARNLEFEEAARLRDQIEKLRHQAFGVPDSRAG